MCSKRSGLDGGYILQGFYGASASAEEVHMESDAYAKNSVRYDRLTEPSASKLRKKGLEVFPPRENLKILDVCCGTGTLLALYARPGCDLVGIDLSPSMLDLARQKLGSSARLLLEDARHMSFPDAQFDLVTIMLALHEMPADTRLRVLGECLRVTKPGGRVLVIDFHYGPYPFPRGWLLKAFIVWAELGAGREHFSHYREFLATRGLDALVEKSGAIVERRFVFDPGVAALYLLKR
jgi:ubiquinone/menaquinone biosynthesis C-methylase UbiE